MVTRRALLVLAAVAFGTVTAQMKSPFSPGRSLLAERQDSSCGSCSDGSRCCGARCLPNQFDCCSDNFHSCPYVSNPRCGLCPAGQTCYDTENEVTIFTCCTPDGSCEVRTATTGSGMLTFTIPPSSSSAPSFTRFANSSSSVPPASQSTISSPPAPVAVVPSSSPTTVPTSPSTTRPTTGSPTTTQTVPTQANNPSSVSSPNSTPSSPSAAKPPASTASGSSQTVAAIVPSYSSPSQSVCPSRSTNTAYSAPTTLPSDYTWGCPPGTLCVPKSRCLIEAAPPDRNFVCSPEDCLPTPPLAPLQYWGVPITSDETSFYVLQNDYFNLNPTDFNLDFSIFVKVCPALDKRSHLLSGRDTLLPPECYDDCNAAVLEAQSTGKVLTLCDDGSAFASCLSGCNECIQLHSNDKSASFKGTPVQTQVQQWLDYCFGQNAQPVISSISAAMDLQSTSTSSGGSSSSHASQAAPVTVTTQSSGSSSSAFNQATSSSTGSRALSSGMSSSSMSASASATSGSGVLNIIGGSTTISVTNPAVASAILQGINSQLSTTYPGGSTTSASGSSTFRTPPNTNGTSSSATTGPLTVSVSSANKIHGTSGGEIVAIMTWAGGLFFSVCLGLWVL